MRYYKRILNFVIGLIIISINLYWIWDNLYLMYRYRIPGIMWLFMYPDWVLILNAILGLIGIYMAILMIIERMKIIWTILINALILFAGGLLKMIIMM